MKRAHVTTLFLFALLVPNNCFAIEQENLQPQDFLQCGEPEPPLVKPKAPYSTLQYRLRDRRGRQTLSVRYGLAAGTVDFELKRTGQCESRVKGTAVIKPCWWLGAETDEDESGNAYFVQEYVSETKHGCTIHLRIGEGDWRFAWVHDECNTPCAASAERMYLEKQ